MINIFSKGTTDFYMTGKPVNALACDLTMEINSTWMVELTIPLHEQGAELIDYGAFVEVPSPFGYQLFYIVEFNKSLTKVTATGYPIGMVLLQKSVFHYDTRPEKTDCNTAISRLVEPIKNTSVSEFRDTYGNYVTLTGQSDITTKKTAYWQLMTGIDALNGDDENTLISRWGGEIKWNNFNVQVLEHIGQTLDERDWDFPITVGFNCQEMDVEYDYSEVVTRVIPKAYNGYLLPESQRYVESTRTDKPSFPIYKVIEYSNIKYIDDASDSDDEDVQVFYTMSAMYAYMRQVARDEFKVNHIDEPSFVCNVSIIDLYNNPKYEDFKNQLSLGLGDYMTVYNEDLEVETEARVTKLKYDCILGQTTDITIGSTGKNYFTKTTDLNRTVAKVISTQKSALQLDSATGILHGNDKGLIPTGTAVKEGCDTWWDIDSGSASFGNEVTFKGTIATEKNIYSGGNIFMQDTDSSSGYKYGQIAIGQYDSKTKTTKSGSTYNTPALQLRSQQNLSVAYLQTNILNGSETALVRVMHDGSNNTVSLMAGNNDTSDHSEFDVKKDTIQASSLGNCVFKANKTLSLQGNEIQVSVNGKTGKGLTGDFNNVTGFTVVGGLVTSVKQEN